MERLRESPKPSPDPAEELLKERPELGGLLNLISSHIYSPEKPHYLKTPPV